MQKYFSGPMLSIEPLKYLTVESFIDINNFDLNVPVI